MQTEQRVTWERLAVELELLTTEDPTSLSQLLQGLNRWLCPDDSLEWSLRTLNFMTYEMMALSEGKTENERFDILNEYYFRKKGFQVLQLNGHEVFDRHLLLKPVLEQRAGAPIVIALLYLHFAAHLDLPVYLVQLRNHHLLKWVRGEKSTYVDLCGDGRTVNDQELVTLLTKSIDHQSAPESLCIVPNRKNFIRYCEELLKVYDRLSLKSKLHSMYNVLLKIEPQNSRLLGRRALLRKEMGFQKDSLTDLKRYFSFVDRSQAPSELVAAYQELSSGMESLRGPFPDLLH